MRSAYLLEVHTEEDPNPICDNLIARCPSTVEVVVSGIGPGRAFIRYRAGSEEEAKWIAEFIRPQGGYQLSTGFAVNRREITVA